VAADKTQGPLTASRGSSSNTHGTRGGGARLTAKDTQAAPIITASSSTIKARPPQGKAQIASTASGRPSGKGLSQRPMTDYMALQTKGTRTHTMPMEERVHTHTDIVQNSQTEPIPSWVRYGYLNTLREPPEEYVDAWLDGRAVRPVHAAGWTATNLGEKATGDRPKLWGYATDCWCCSHKKDTCHSCDKKGSVGARHGILSQALMETDAKTDKAGCCKAAVWCSQCGARCCTHAFVCHACYTCNGGVDCTGGLLPVRKPHHRAGVG
jgi:hypothetical protein